MCVRLVVVAAALAASAFGQTVCPPTPAYSTCDITFELNDAEAAAHPNPYLTVQLEAEFRSPQYKTYRMPAFWDGGRKLVIRFAPTEAGPWDFRVTSNLVRFDGAVGQALATESDAAGFVRPANVHHWATGNKQPHLWMGDTSYRFGYMDRSTFDRMVDARAAQKFNHIRGLVLGWGDVAKKAYPSPDRPNPAYFDEIDQRVIAMNRKGITADLILAGDQNSLTSLFPTWQQRAQFVRYIVARYAPMNITWQGVEHFETYQDGRNLVKEIGLLLKKLDPYDHPRSTSTVATSSPLLGDGWMNFLVYETAEDAVGSVEHQLYPNSQVNAGFASEDTGAGRAYPNDVDSDTFRHRLWNSTMDGLYPTFANTGTAGVRTITPDARYLDSPGARAMKAWYKLFVGTRHWELEPYFDVDGGRAVALEDVEYIIYVEKPGPVEVLVTKHKYDVAWMNPATGELTLEKDFKGDKFDGEPPDRTHDWVLHLSREGHKESMLKSYKFVSERDILMQEVETNPQKVPFEIVEPAGGDLSVSQPAHFAVKVKRETRATRVMTYLWTGEVAADGRGIRVIGTGANGALAIPPSIAVNYPAVLVVRLTALNANGKAYVVDRVYTLKR